MFLATTSSLAKVSRPKNPSRKALITRTTSANEHPTWPPPTLSPEIVDHVLVGKHYGRVIAEAPSVDVEDHGASLLAVLNEMDRGGQTPTRQRSDTKMLLWRQSSSIHFWGLLVVVELDIHAGPYSET